MSIHEGFETYLSDHPGMIPGAPPSAYDYTQNASILEESELEGIIADEMRRIEAEMLRSELRLDLSNYELKDPETDLGTVVSITEQAPTSEEGRPLPEGVNVFEIRVEDSYVEADPEMYALVTEYVEHIEAMMRKLGFDPLDKDRTEADNREQWNKFTKAWLADKNVEGLAAWRDNVPTALALENIYHIMVGQQIKAHDGQTYEASKETVAQLRFVADAVAIRDRRTAMVGIAGAYIPYLDLQGGDLNWLSLASGTTDPSMHALVQARDTLGINFNLVGADMDGTALQRVNDKAAEHGIPQDRVQTIRANILGERFPDNLAKKVGRNKFKVVENNGFEEYLPQGGDALGAKKGQGLPQASEFTRMAYDRVEEGGILISGNMVRNRKQVNFVFGAVDWPIINARSEAEIMNVYDQAGILRDPRAEVNMFRIVNNTTGVQLYNIVVVRKLPADRSQWS